MRAQRIEGRGSESLGLWLDSLKAGASGDADQARRLLRHDLPLALLEPSPKAQNRYTGPLPQAVRWYINKHIPYYEQQLARQNEDDFLMYVFQDVLVGVEKPLLLVELCLKEPHAALDDLVRTYAWEAGLKRSPAQKREWIADHLQSMHSLGVPLPQTIISTLNSEGIPKYEYNERAFATSLDRMKKSWGDFKHEQGLDVAFEGVNTSETNDRVEEEAVEIGARLKARLILSEEPEILLGGVHDMIIIGRRLGPELTRMLDEMHAAAPLDGYYPVAWHKVFWEMCFKYFELPLELDRLEPYRERDADLKDHIVAFYTEVRGKSVSFIRQRRESLEKRCDETVLLRLSERLEFKPQEQ